MAAARMLLSLRLLLLLMLLLMATAVLVRTNLMPLLEKNRFGGRRWRR